MKKVLQFKAILVLLLMPAFILASNSSMKGKYKKEKAYHEEGYQTVSVSIPPQSVNSGVIVLKVTEATVERKIDAETRCGATS